MAGIYKPSSLNKCTKFPTFYDWKQILNNVYNTIILFWFTTLNFILVYQILGGRGTKPYENFGHMYRWLLSFLIFWLAGGSGKTFFWLFLTFWYLKKIEGGLEEFLSPVIFYNDPWRKLVLVHPSNEGRVNSFIFDYKIDIISQ